MSRIVLAMMSEPAPRQCHHVAAEVATAPNPILEAIEHYVARWNSPSLEPATGARTPARAG